MASALPGNVSAVQVGTYFVGQYYQILQSRPHFVHQFYYEGSTMMRIDGDTTETATGMHQIHSLIMSLNYTGIEIKTAHSVDSWNGGVLVMISGYVQTRDYNTRRKFVQTFFLAPQEKGYFVLNDIFHFLEEEQMHHYAASIMANNNFQSKLNTSNSTPEPVSEYMLGGEAQSRDFVTPEFADQVHTEDNEAVDKYSIPEQPYSIPEQPYSISEQPYTIPEQPQQVPEAEERAEQHPVEEPVASFSSAVSTVRDPPPAPAEEPVGEQPKHTYASILRIARGQPGHSVSHTASLNKTLPVASEWHQPQQSTTQQAYPVQSTGPEKAVSEAVEEVATHEEEGDPKSVYVGNLPSTISDSDLEQEFKKFGRLRPDGVTIRSRKETGVFYGFIEFEDSVGVQNALKASPVLVNGRQIHVEERRPNSGASRGRRGRGRGGYQLEVPRGRFGGRSFGRGIGQDNSDREFNSRLRGNGFAPRGPRQDRGILGNHVSRNGQAPYDTSS